MPKHVQIPLETFGELQKVWEEIARTSVIVDGTPDPTPAPPPTTDPSVDVIWFDPHGGHPQNDGATPASSISTWASLIDRLKPRTRTLVMLRTGFYRSNLTLANRAADLGSPIYFKAEQQGGVIFDGFYPTQDKSWEYHGNGVYRRVSSDEEGPWCGYAKGYFLPRLKSLSDLQNATAGDVRLPKYGFCKEGRFVYVRLPGKDDPNKVQTYLTQSFGRNFIRLNHSPYVIFDGIVFRGHGSGKAILCDEDSHHVWIQNCTFSHGRIGAELADDSTVQWNQYGYPGFAQFAKDVFQLNNGDPGALFEYVKNYNHADGNKANALLEGRIFDSIKSRSAVRLTSRYNFSTECFDGSNFGQFSDSTSYNDIGDDIFDDWTEFESSFANHDSRNITLDRPAVLSASAAFSHQDFSGRMKGPHKITRAIVWNLNKSIASPYVIKNMSSADKKPVTVTYDHCLFQNLSDPTTWGQNVNFLYLDHRKGKNINLTITNSIIIMDAVTDWDKTWDPDCDHNVLVSPKDHPHLRGPNGIWVTTFEELGLQGGIEEMNFKPTEDSPHFGKASDGKSTPGPHQIDDELPLCRPFIPTFTDEIPGMWGSE